jgi:hypothetical protein
MTTHHHTLSASITAPAFGASIPNSVSKVEARECVSRWSGGQGYLGNERLEGVFGDPESSLCADGDVAVPRAISAAYLVVC